MDLIRVGIVGLSANGGIAATAHLPALRALPGYEVTALTAGSPASTKAAAMAFGVRHGFDTAEALAESDEVDLVVVAVRVPYHKTLVRAALGAGKNVLCEWPLGRNLAEASALAAAARASAVRTAVGLQARSSPTLRYLADLIADGYIGRPLSTSILANGNAWGASVATPAGRYLLARESGASLLTIPFAHALDGLAFVLGEPNALRATLATQRSDVLDEATGAMLPMSVADQVVVGGTLDSGAVASIHYRGGRSRASAFRWEINGTDGDLLIVANTGHFQLSVPTVSSARHGDKELAQLEVPASYRNQPTLEAGDAPASYNIGYAYARLHEDLSTGSHEVPDFDHAARRHGVLQDILLDAGEPWASSGG